MLQKCERESERDFLKLNMQWGHCVCEPSRQTPEGGRAHYDINIWLYSRLETEEEEGEEEEVEEEVDGFCRR